MKARTYLGFQVLAVAAGAWSAIEAVLRLAVGEPAGAGSAGMLALLAAGMITAAGARRRQLATQAIAAGDSARGDVG